MNAKEIAAQWSMYHIHKNTKIVYKEQKCLAQAHLDLLAKQEGMVLEMKTLRELVDEALEAYPEGLMKWIPFRDKYKAMIAKAKEE